MAEAVLFNLATDILKSLATEMAKPAVSFASQKILSLYGAKDELQSLQGTVQTIQAVLLDAEKQQWHNSQVKLWLGRLKDVLYDIQELLDDVATEDLRRKVTPGNKMLKAARILFSKSNQLAYRLKVANEIQKLRKGLDQIKKDREEFHFQELRSEATMAISRGKKTEIFAPDRSIIGRKGDKEKIKRLLFDSFSSQSVSFVAIVGKGGLGKTALARLVYNDGELLRDLEDKPIDQLPRLLREIIVGKKYLLVLDDLWNEDRGKWLKLGEWLEDGLWGSKILITTRSHKVTQVTNAESLIHNLHGLSEDKSWNLFRRMAFGDGAKPLDPELEKMGCLLYTKEKDLWLRYKERELPEIQEIDKDDDGILRVLKFSYDHLPSCLKHCFAYCSLFPKHHVYEKDMMIHLWVAQGFIESCNGEDNLEEVAENYLSELLCRSFLDVAEKGNNGEVLKFKMHDLMHDLAQKVAGGECKIFGFNGDNAQSCPKVAGLRHASFILGSGEEMVSLLENSKLRTILYLREKSFGLNYIFSGCGHCRALDLPPAVTIPLPPSSYGKLKLLRFLHIRDHSFVSLPDSITDLVNLQTLKLSRCQYLQTFPRDMRKLVEYLIIDSTKMLDRQSMAHANSSSEGIVEAAFITFPKLKRLTLHGDDSRGYIDHKNIDHSMLDTILRSASNLESIFLFNCDLDELSLKMQHLSSLQDLYIHNCIGLFYWIQEEGGPNLKNLRVLNISSCFNLGDLPEGIQHMIILQSLEIHDCKMMENLPICIGKLSLLEKLVLSDCPRLEQLPYEMRSLVHLKELRILSCPALEKRCLPDMHIPVIIWEDESSDSD
ncbi:hypothetical protein BT93_H1826 [Corymbia citriodora subsp. variegata]|nr:hypothetical protein BT93_H1826 [Corymbia citriodora subsp. variegata]